MAKAKSWLPEGHSAVTPHLTIRDAAKAIDFYKKAFAAEEVFRHAMPDGRLMHADLIIGGSHVLLCDEFPEMDCGASPQTLGKAHAHVHLFVEDVDKVFNQAVQAGAQVKMPVQDMFWGDRYGVVIDPFGQPWSIATHKEDLTPEEINKRGQEAFKEMALAKK